MVVKISFLSVLARVAGGKEFTEDIEDGSTIESLLAAIQSRAGEEFGNVIYDPDSKLNEYILILVNGTDFRSLGGLATALYDGDEIVILPAIAGG
jgi:MoaD family protein